jgi:hypothetical protein
MAFEGGERARFVGAHHLRIANDISRENGGQAPICLAFGHGSIPMGYQSAAPALSGQTK